MSWGWKSQQTDSDTPHEHSTPRFKPDTCYRLPPTNCNPTNKAFSIIASTKSHGGFPNKLWLLPTLPEIKTQVQVARLFSSCCHLYHHANPSESFNFPLAQLWALFLFLLMKQIAPIHHHLKAIVWISTSCCYCRATDTSFQHLSIKTPLDLGSVTPRLL